MVCSFINILPIAENITSIKIFVSNDILVTIIALEMIDKLVYSLEGKVVE